MKEGRDLFFRGGEDMSYVPLSELNFPQNFEKYDIFKAPEYDVKDLSNPYNPVILPKFRYAHDSIGGVNLSCNIKVPYSGDNLTRNKKVTILTGIISSIPNVSQRQTLRETWLKKTSNSIMNFEYIFVLGINENNIIPDYVIEELNVYRDILILPIHDTYKNMIHKVIGLFEFSLKFCGALYTLRANDDVYLRLDDVYSSLKNEQTYSIYAGYFLNDVKVLREEDEINPDFIKSSKVTISQYPADVYPTFTQGNAYILSQDLSSKVSQLIQQPWRKLIADDILTGLIIDSVPGVRRIHVESDFVPDGGRFECDEDSLWEFDVSEDMIRMFYDNDVNGREHCYGIP